jgi:putative sigma-54 modulation protein
MKKVGKESETMRVQVKGKNMPITADLKKLVVQKMGRLDKYFDKVQLIEVELCTEKTKSASYHNHVEVTTRVAGRTIRVTADDDEMYAAVDQIVDKLYRRLNRQKERLKSHHGVKRPAAAFEHLEPESPETALSSGAEEDDGTSIHVESLEVKPQFEEEAALELEALGRDFYVFLNARNEQVNVLYRKGDGSYGLIEPYVG